jgi:hypothetical protein
MQPAASHRSCRFGPLRALASCQVAGRQRLPPVLLLPHLHHASRYLLLLPEPVRQVRAASSRCSAAGYCWVRHCGWTGAVAGLGWGRGWGWAGAGLASLLGWGCGCGWAEAGEAAGGSGTRGQYVAHAAAVGGSKRTGGERLQARSPRCARQATAPPFRGASAQRTAACACRCKAVRSDASFHRSVVTLWSRSLYLI